YRTGTRFACEEAGIVPDILCLGKALTGGTLPMGATLASAAVFEAFYSDDAEAAFMHGPTYMANPLACAAAHASLDVFEQEPRAAQVEAIEAQLREQLEPCRGQRAVVDVRVKGAIGVVQMLPEVDVYALRPRFVERGVWIRPFGDIVYLAPPFTISREELTQLTSAICAVVQSC
ncbi:MAG: aminotransferase class III-fold pyridoxal phosphate-dependent enzyme, partial [Proteobacteria bacterium]|nr:aminotransferase class III-fold pyridoxal phosphate-dependent enzyme [Pseudomonadota bacterium]